MPRRFPNDVHLQLYSTSPAPKRDYHGLTVTGMDVILNSWDISRGPHVFPRKRKQSLETFGQDRWFQSEISALFGPHTVNYILRLSRGERNLCCLPESLVLYIVRKLAVNDILHLRQTSKIFFEMCNTNPVWKILYEKRMQRAVNKMELKQSETMSWKYLLRRHLQQSRATSDRATYERFVREVAIARDEQMLAAMRFKHLAIEPWVRRPDEALYKRFETDKIQVRTYKGDLLDNETNVDQQHKKDKKMASRLRRSSWKQFK